MTTTSLVTSTNALTALTTLAGTEVVRLVDGTTSKKVTVANLAAHAVASGTVREKLTADRTYYVRTDGSNSNTGLANTSGGAFLTIQKAIDVALGNLDFGGKNVTIQVGAGTYTETLTAASPKVGAGILTILGDAATPANCILVSGSACLFASGAFVGTIRGFRLQPSAGYGLAAAGAGTHLNFRDIEFAGAASRHVYVYQGATVEATGNYEIRTADAAGFFAFVSDPGSYFSSFGRTVNIVGSLTFSIFIQVETLAGAQFGGCTFTGGSASGYRYYVLNNAVLHTYGAGATYLPGGTNGLTGTGGLYV